MFSLINVMLYIISCEIDANCSDDNKTSQLFKKYAELEHCPILFRYLEYVLTVCDVYKNTNIVFILSTAAGLLGR